MTKKWLLLSRDGGLVLENKGCVYLQPAALGAVMEAYVGLQVQMSEWLVLLAGGRGSQGQQHGAGSRTWFRVRRTWFSES